MSSGGLLLSWRSECAARPIPVPHCSSYIGDNPSNPEGPRTFCSGAFGAGEGMEGMGVCIRFSSAPGIWGLGNR